MKRIGLLLRVALAVALAQLGWTWLQRHDADLRIRRMLDGRRPRSEAPRRNTGTGARIVQFYARAGEVVEGDRKVICYGVENARTVRLDPPVESVEPALVRCFWIEPHEDTTYRLIADAPGGRHDEASFMVKVRPAPPVFRMVAVSEKAIPPGEVVTVCYNVDHASGVVLHPLGWRLPPGAKNCVRFYPKQTMDYALIASGTAGMQARERFRVAVK